MAEPKAPTTPASAVVPTKAKRERKPKAVVTIPAAQAKAIAKALDGYAKYCARTNDRETAVKMANISAGLYIAAEYNTSEGA